MTNTERKKMWMDRIAAYKLSGQTVPAWCRENDVKAHQLRYWLRKEKQNSSNPKAEDTCAWLPLNLTETETNSSVTVHLGQVSIEVSPGFEPKLLLDVVNTLKGQQC